MQLPIIKCYTSSTPSYPHCFYIQSKGNNSGKPLKAPAANCFICICNDYDHFETFYWLCYGLWKAGHFSPYLKGSVIPFIRLSDCNTAIYQGYSQSLDNNHQYRAAVIKMRKFDIYYKQALELLKLQQNNYRSLLHSALFYDTPTFRNH